MAFTSIANMISSLGGSVVRNTSRWNFNEFGVLTEVPANTVTDDFDPITTAHRGIPLEPGRTNQIPNSAVLGMIAGTPGTLPTGWTIINGTGFTRTVLEPFVQRGITHFAVRHNGTPDASAIGYNFGIATGGNVVPALPDQVWTFSIWMALLAGSFTNISVFRLIIDFRDSTNTVLRTDSVDVMPAMITAGANTQRYTFTCNPAPANTDRVQARVVATTTIGAAIDYTIAYGLPQLELGSFATSPIVTTGSALNRAADIINFPFPNTWGRVDEGTLIVDVTPYALETDRTLAILWNGTSVQNGSMRIRTGATDALQTGFRVVNDNNEQVFNNNTGSNAAGTNRRIAVAWRGLQTPTHDFGYVVNGVLGGATLGAFPMPTSNSLTQLRVGSGGGAGAPAMHLRRLVFYRERLPNATLQALTA